MGMLNLMALFLCIGSSLFYFFSKAKDVTVDIFEIKLAHSIPGHLGRREYVHFVIDRDEKII